MLTVYPTLLSRFACVGCLVVWLGACDNSSKSTHGEDHNSNSSHASSASSSSNSSSGLALGDCTGTDASVCGDFDGLPGEDEDAELPLPSGWSIDVRGGGTVTMTSENAYSGDRSIKVVSGGGDNRAFLTMDLNHAPPLKQEMFGSMWLYLSDENSNSGDFTFLQAEGGLPQLASNAPSDTSVMYRGKVDGRHDHIFTNYFTHYERAAGLGNEWPTDCWKQPSLPPQERYVLPKNEWFCMQWHIKQSNNHIDFTINGQILTAIRVFNTGHGCAHDTQGGIWYAPQTFERLHLGVEQYAAEALPRTLYIDDIHLDTQLVECDGSLSDPRLH